MSGTVPPHCPTCSCRDERGPIDTSAPFYGLVLELDRIVWQETTNRAKATAAATRADRRARQEDP